MKIEEYKKKKLKELEKWSMNMDEFAYNYLKTFFTQTIDELGKLPEGLECVDDSLTWEDTIHNSNDVRFGWNACIAEAERMRDLSIKGKR